MELVSFYYREGKIYDPGIPQTVRRKLIFLVSGPDYEQTRFSGEQLRLQAKTHASGE
jgi:hypothetical protein